MDLQDLPPLKILLVDDNAQNRQLLNMFLKRREHTVVEAVSGEAAIELFQSEQPELVLMDVMMPGIDGIEATRRIRELSQERWVPIIFVSALSQHNHVVEGLEAGGDDYIGKPVDLALLDAKIRAMQRISMLQSRLRSALEQLQVFHAADEKEQEMAQQLMAKLIQVERLEDPLLATWHQPATRFSGDLLAAARSPTGQLYILNADSTGHGLSAALPLMLVVRVFYEMAESGYSIATIAKRMNQVAHDQLPRDRFVTAVMARIDTGARICEVWNGGHPTAYFISHEDDKVKSFASSAPALGVMPDTHFKGTTEVHHFDCPGKFLIYSDGCVEARNAAGEQFGEQRILDAARQSPVDNMRQGLVDALMQHIGDSDIQDDMSFAVVSCPVE